MQVPAQDFTFAVPKTEQAHKWRIHLLPVGKGEMRDLLLYLDGKGATA